MTTTTKTKVQKSVPTQTKEQSAVITTANASQIIEMLTKLNQERPEYMVSTTKVKQHKNQIKEALNISDKVYLSLLKCYKDNQIIKAKSERDSDKRLLKDFEHTARMVLQDMQQDARYSTYLRDVVKQYNNNVMEFVQTWCKEFDGTKFLSIHTLYNFDENVIIRKYQEDTNLTYNKVYSLVSKCIDNLFAARKAGIQDKEFALSKYTEGYVIEVYKFDQFEDVTKRPTKGAKIDKPTEKMLSNLITWSDYKDSLQ